MGEKPDDHQQIICSRRKLVLLTVTYQGQIGTQHLCKLVLNVIHQKFWVFIPSNCSPGSVTHDADFYETTAMLYNLPNLIQEFCYFVCMTPNGQCYFKSCSVQCIRHPFSFFIRSGSFSVVIQDNGMQIAVFIRLGNGVSACMLWQLCDVVYR